MPGVFGDSSTTGLPLNETTVADQVMYSRSTVDIPLSFSTI